MNSTLPNFLATPSAPATGAGQLNPAALADLPTGLLAVPAGAGPAPEFAALMPSSPVAVAATMNTLTVTNAAQSQSWSRGALAPEPPGWCPQSVEKVATGSAEECLFIGNRPEGGPAPLSVLPLVSQLPTEPVLEKPAAVPDEIREQAVAFALALLQGLRPETMSAPQSAPEVTVTVNSGSQMPTTDQAGPDSGQTASPESAPVPVIPSVPPAPNLAFEISDFKSDGAQPLLVVAPDGGVEFKIALPPQAAAGMKSENPKFTGLPVEIHAELAVPGRPVVRVEAAGYAAPDAPLAVHRENFAGKIRTAKSVSAMPAGGVERNFEFTGDKQVKSRSPQAGIGVAQIEATMPAAPIEEPRATRKPQDLTVSPVRAEFQVAQAPAERITASAPGPAGQTFAERAVDTVTGLVEAQFAASMQKAGSVHLRLKFGGEDLSVHVAIRDGAVHTDFRTDSAPLRAALEREWQAVAAASPGQMQRYAEPVFSPGSAHGGSNPSFSQSGDHSRQPSAQQQQAQSDAQQRAPREAFDGTSAFTRRSLVSESFVPEPPAPRGPALLPTSLRLSALA